MKKYFMAASIMAIATFFFNCHGSKKATASAPALSYEGHIKTLIAADCSPCHIPAKGGNKKPFDTYDNAKTNIDEMIRRIELNPEDRGFMPFKHPKLSDSTIAVLKKWRDDGLREK
jgi:hypothetical protein